MQSGDQLSVFVLGPLIVSRCLWSARSGSIPRAAACSHDPPETGSWQIRFGLSQIVRCRLRPGMAPRAAVDERLSSRLIAGQPRRKPAN